MKKIIISLILSFAMMITSVSLVFASINGKKRNDWCSTRPETLGNFNIESVAVDHEHEFTNYVSNKDATCKVDGTKTATCDVDGCGEKDTITDVGSKELISHTVGDAVRENEVLSTCTQEGSYDSVIYCTVCDAEIDRESDVPIPQIEHKFNCYIYNNDSTCMEDGTKTAACDYGCGMTDTITAENTRNPDNHLFVEYDSNNDATCKTDGTKTAGCSHGCGTENTITDVGSKNSVPHTMGEIEKIITLSANCVHDGTYYEQQTCTVCETYQSRTENKTDPKIPHVFETYISDKNETCREDGTKTAMCEYGCGTKDTITDVGSKNPTSHIMGPVIKKVTKEPTCMKEGAYYEERTCTVCNDYQNRTGSKIDSIVDHKYENYSSNGDATCKSDGTKTSQCKFGCGNKNTITDVGSKNSVPHTMGEIKKIITLSANCVHDGTYYEQQTCTVCGTYQSRTENKTEPKIPHVFETYTSDNNATCIEDGTKSSQCKYGCGTEDIIADIGSALGHDWVFSKLINEQTVGKNGEIEYKCSRCETTKNEKTDELTCAKPIDIVNGEYLITLVKGGKTEVIGDIAKAAGDKKWSVNYSVKGIASISAKGIVKGLKPGETVATITSDHGNYTLKIKVSFPKFEKGTLVINKGETLLDIGFTGTDLEKEFSSNKTGVVNVDKSSGAITGAGYGKARITVLAGGKKYTRNVQVFDPIFKVKKTSLMVGEKLSIKVKQGAKITQDWTSSNEAVATVDSKGKVTGVAPGKTTISAVNNGIKMTLEINVE